MKTYPEHEKLDKIKAESQTIGGFMEWLTDEKKVQLKIYEEERIVYFDKEFEKNILPSLSEIEERAYQLNNPNSYEYIGGLVNYKKSTEQMLAEYFNIDLKVLEAEKRDMLADIREMNKNNK